MHWFSGAWKPKEVYRGGDPIIQRAIVELDKELPSKKYSWKEAIKSLLNKNYSPAELSNLLCQKIECNIATAATWFRKKARPKDPTIQKAIVELDKELPSKYKKKKVPKKRKKRYGLKFSSDLEEHAMRAKAEHLYLKTGKVSAIAKEMNLASDKVIFLLSDMPSLPWKEAIDELIEKGYLMTDLAKKLTTIIDCRYETAYSWVRKRVNNPPIAAQKAIIELNKTLPSN